ncbi:Lysine ketoglutarate reductase trans-splicing protein [Heracleum sosnowskyi]|uniref:Lysine ketoglutarate reductase trans-splicing protein n=1 Tax=Heracleum sosnowskyi TaxID=360622 RepID=A0AAD8JIH5_9APIA|nr:Lysine ketoglutarate reductase trans-splicing protein [Heracleum sosnowskyi]
MKYSKTRHSMEHFSHRRNTSRKKQNENMRLILIILVGVVCGFLIGVSHPVLWSDKMSPIFSTIIKARDVNDTSKIWVPSNPRGAERLVPGIVVPHSDLYLRRMYGKPSEDLTITPKYLVTFTVGYNQRHNIDASIKKFSENFTILLFHYDNRATEWDEYEWSKKVIHVTAPKQTKWWYAKRFLHPDIVAAYDYIFIWDEDLGVENFDAEEYIKLVKKHGLEISQPGLNPQEGQAWRMTRRMKDSEVHKKAKEIPEWCKDPHLPPCAAFVEIMAPVFSRDAWRCVWHMIQNDLVHGWGLDLALQHCVEPAYEKIGVVDAQWIVHQGIPSLGDNGQGDDGKQPRQGQMRLQVRKRCKLEWKIFGKRFKNAEKDYYKSMGIDPSNIPHHTNFNRSLSMNNHSQTSRLKPLAKKVLA